MWEDAIEKISCDIIAPCYGDKWVNRSGLLETIYCWFHVFGFGQTDPGAMGRSIKLLYPHDQEIPG